MNEMINSLPMPTIKSVAPLSDHCVRVVWEETIRPYRTEDIDLTPLIKTLKFYKPLRDDKALFNSVRVIDFGHAVGWGEDDELDMAATSIERLAEESMSANDFREFLHTNKLTQERAAIVLGRSRPQIANYVSGKYPIPRVVVLACYGYLFRKRQYSGGLRSGSHVIVGAQPLTSTRDNHTITKVAV